MNPLFDKYNAATQNFPTAPMNQQPINQGNGFFGFPNTNEFMNQVSNIQQAVMQTRQNPQALVYSMLNSGQINQQKLDQAISTARQIMSMLPNR